MGAYWHIGLPLAVDIQISDNNTDKKEFLSLYTSFFDFKRNYSVNSDMKFPDGYVMKYQEHYENYHLKSDELLKLKEIYPDFLKLMVEIFIKNKKESFLKNFNDDKDSFLKNNFSKMDFSVNKNEFIAQIQTMNNYYFLNYTHLPAIAIYEGGLFSRDHCSWIDFLSLISSTDKYLEDSDDVKILEETLSFYKKMGYQDVISHCSFICAF